MKNMKVWVVFHTEENSRQTKTTIRTEPVPGEWLAGPDRNCGMVSAWIVNIKTAKAIARHYGLIGEDDA